MSINQTLKIELQFKGNPDYHLTPTPDRTYQEHKQVVCEYQVITTEIFKFSVYANADADNQLQIKNISLNQRPLYQIDQFGRYHCATGVRKTHGYMDEPGEYVFKIRYNALSHEFLTYILKKA